MEYIEPNSERYLSLEDLPDEVWKDIKNYEGLYQISDYGRVKSLEKYSKHANRIYPTKILKGLINTKEYVEVELSKKGKPKRYRLHRLVAEAFIPNPENKPQINHIDCNKQNNNIDNLEWCTNGENQQHAFRNGLNYRKKLGESPRAKSVKQYDLNGNFIKLWDCVTRIKLELGFQDSYICECCKGKYKKAYGYIWKYAKESD